jgi:hypothetical protein
MRKAVTMTKKFAAFAALMFLALGAGVSADHAWGNYHWPYSGGELGLKLGDNVDSRWDGYLTQARDDWNVSAVLATTVDVGQAKGNCRPPDGRTEVCNASYGQNGWLGLAQIWVSGDHIVKAAVKLNDSYHDYTPYDQAGWRDLVMCQEVGHIFGLDHQDENFENTNLGTCMDYTSNPDGPLANRQPNSHDYEQLTLIYNHNDGGSGGGSGGCKGPAWKCAGQQSARPPAFDELDLPGIGQWGRMVSTSRDGGQSEFVLDFGNGYRIHTHVTWTLDVAARLARP